MDINFNVIMGEGNSKHNLAPETEKMVRKAFRRLMKKHEDELIDHLAQEMAELHKHSPMAQLARAAREGSHLFWAASAWAVVYAVARDVCNYQGSVADFERLVAQRWEMPKGFEHPCTPGRIQNTIDTTPYMRAHISRWEAQGAKRRVLAFLQFLQKTQ